MLSAAKKNLLEARVPVDSFLLRNCNLRKQMPWLALVALELFAVNFKLLRPLIFGVLLIRRI